MSANYLGKVLMAWATPTAAQGYPGNLLGLATLYSIIISNCKCSTANNCASLAISNWESIHIYNSMQVLIFDSHNGQTYLDAGTGAG